MYNYTVWQNKIANMQKQYGSGMNKVKKTLELETLKNRIFYFSFPLKIKCPGTKIPGHLEQKLYD